MSRISSINSYNTSASFMPKTAKTAFSPSFSGGYTNLPENAQKEVVKYLDKAISPGIDKKLGALGVLYKKLASTKGELQSQLLNALFTTTLAPLVIRYNPISNKSADDKRYAAWRQPLSAILALGCTAPITYGFNKYVDKLYNEGHDKSTDLRMTPGDGYLKSKFNSDFKEAKKAGDVKLDEFLEKYKPDEFSGTKFNGNTPTKAYKKALQGAYVKKVQKERLAIFSKLITEHPDDIVIDEATKIISSKKTGEKIAENIPNLITKPQLEEYKLNNNLHNKTFGKILKEHFDLEFFDDGALKGQFKPESVKTTLSKTKALDFLEKVGLLEEKKVNDSELRTAILSLRQQKQGTEVAKKLELIGKDTSRNVQLTVGEELGKAKSISLGQFFHQLDYKTTDSSLQSLMDMKSNKAIEALKTKLTGKLPGIKDGTTLSNIAEKMLKMASNKKSFFADKNKFFLGIILNLFTTAISCSILNWSYPRMMELLNKNKTDNAKKGGNK